MARPTIGIIGDTHIPFELEGYLEHCVNMFDMWGVDIVVHVGDVIDNHAISYHEHDPNGMSDGDEILAAVPKLEKWVSAFPDMLWVTGNHDDLPYRKAMTHGLARKRMADYASIFEIDGLRDWKYQEEHIIDGIVFRHGMGATGKYGHRNAAEKMACNVVQGHSHSVAGIEYIASQNQLIWGMAVGCGVDKNAYAAHYGRHMVSKPVISCAVIVEGTPIVLPMDLGSKFKIETIEFDVNDKETWSNEEYGYWYETGALPIR